MTGDFTFPEHPILLPLLRRNDVILSICSIVQTFDLNLIFLPPYLNYCGLNFVSDLQRVIVLRTSVDRYIVVVVVVIVVTDSRRSVLHDMNSHPALVSTLFNSSTSHHLISVSFWLSLSDGLCCHDHAINLAL